MSQILLFSITMFSDLSVIVHVMILLQNKTSELVMKELLWFLFNPL